MRKTIGCHRFDTGAEQAALAAVYCRTNPLTKCWNTSANSRKYQSGCSTAIRISFSLSIFLALTVGGWYLSEPVWASYFFQQ